MADHDAQSGLDAWVGSMPGLGAIADIWIGLRSIDDSKLDHAIGLLSNDAVLCEPVLAWCRAVAGDSAARLSTPHRAVIMLGVPIVRSAVIGVSAVMALNGARPSDSAIDTDGFWTHAISVASCCEHLAQACDVDTGEAMLAGLLHDVGKLALAWSNPERFRRAIETGETNRRSIAGLLRDSFGFDHHTAGKRVIERWGLGDTVRDAAWHYGQDNAGVPCSSDRSAVRLVTFAKRWSGSRHLGWSGESGVLVDGDRSSLTGDGSSLGSETFEGLESAVGLVTRLRATAVGVGAGGDPLAWSVSAALERSAELSGQLRDVRQASERARSLLDAIERFQQSTTLEDAPERVVECIGGSACSLMGVGKVAVVWQCEESSPWRLSLVDDEGHTERSREVVAPPAEAEIRRPADLAGAFATRVLLACDLDWLVRLIEHLKEAGTPVLVGAGAAIGMNGASCLVLAPVPRVTHDIEGLLPIRTMWAWALEGSARSRSARTLGEELVEANRSLTETRDDLAAKQSMVRLGQMAAGAAHELNNPLTVIRGRAQMILEKAATIRQRDDARLIANAAREVSDMVTSLHLLSIPPKMRVMGCDPMLVIRDAIDQARSVVPRSAQKSRVRLNSDGLPSSMELDAELVARALCEPIGNALLARPGSDVYIYIESEPFTDRLKVRVMDRGPGLSKKALMHAFDPFFSEQLAGRRAGLGLARARSLVDLMHGRIEVANNPGDIGGAFAEIVIPQGMPGQQQLAA
ncbi:MAG: HDOD domain-containing protein [Phycisphaerales bacterium]